MKLPEIISGSWLSKLSDEDLLLAESRLHKQYSVIERRERKSAGARYELMRGPADLLSAWDRWSRASGVSRQRGLTIRREKKA